MSISSILNNALLFAIYAMRDEVLWQEAIGKRILHVLFGSGIVEMSDGSYVCIRFGRDIKGFCEEAFHNNPGSKSMFIGMHLPLDERNRLIRIIEARQERVVSLKQYLLNEARASRDS